MNFKQDRLKTKSSHGHIAEELWNTKDKEKVFIAAGKKRYWKYKSDNQADNELITKNGDLKTME